MTSAWIALLLLLNLTADIVNGNGTGQLIWHGDAVIDTMLGTFDPHAGVFGENMVTAIYTEGSCTYSQEIGIFIYQLPLASFTTDAPVCEGEDIVIAYNGPPTPGLSFNWDFGIGIAVPGSGEGPHQVTFPGVGPQPVSLIVENANGCISEVFESSPQIITPLVAPIITCTSTPSSINFTWPIVTGAADYQVNVISGQAGDFTPPNSISFDNLSPNEEVIIELTVVSNGICPPVVTQESCIAIDCPPADLSITPFNESICISSSGLIDFELTVNGGLGSGTATWSGLGIIDADQGIFDPAIAGLGQHVISVFYEEGSCNYSTTTIIEIIDEPTSEFSATPIICINEGAELEYLGNASSTADYDWDLDGGTFDPVELTVSWNMPGIYTLSLVVNQDGCISSMFYPTSRSHTRIGYT